MRPKAGEDDEECYCCRNALDNDEIEAGYCRECGFEPTEDHDDFETDAEWLFGSLLKVAAEARRREIDWLTISQAFNSHASAAANQNLRKKLEEYEEDGLSFDGECPRCGEEVDHHDVSTYHCDSCGIYIDWTGSTKYTNTGWELADADFQTSREEWEDLRREVEVEQNAEEN